MDCFTVRCCIERTRSKTFSLVVFTSVGFIGKRRAALDLYIFEFVGPTTTQERGVDFSLGAAKRYYGWQHQWRRRRRCCCRY
jgi:hypothetical protein